MRIYRKVIPQIAKDIINSLLNKGLIEIDDNKKIEEAELDLAAIIVEYQNTEDKISKEAQQTIIKRSISIDKYTYVKKIISDMYEFKIDISGLDYILNQILEMLFVSNNIDEVFGADNEIKKNIKYVLDKYMKVSEELDDIIRKRIKNIKEGTVEWEIEYARICNILKWHKGLL